MPSSPLIATPAFSITGVRPIDFSTDYAGGILFRPSCNQEMVARMISGRHDDNVLMRVIQRVSIVMVSVFCSRQFSTDHLFSNQPVLVPPLVRISHFNSPINQSVCAPMQSSRPDWKVLSIKFTRPSFEWVGSTQFGRYLWKLGHPFPLTYQFRNRPFLSLNRSWSPFVSGLETASI